MPWWRTAAWSAAVGLAVPMSIPRYTCMASTATISVPGTASAAAIATSDLPDAVGPNTTTAGAVMSLGGDRNARAGGPLGDDRVQLAREVVRRGTGDLDRGVGAGPQRRRRPEVDETVLRRASGQHVRVLLARAVDEDLLDAPDAGLVGGERVALDDDPQAVEALARHRWLDEAVDQVGGLGTGT